MRFAVQATLAALVLFGSGCGNVCDRLPRVTERRCDVEVPETGNDGEDAICAAEAEQAARCAVKNKKAYCEWLEAFAGGDYSVTNAYTECVEG